MLKAHKDSKDYRICQIYQEDLERINLLESPYKPPQREETREAEQLVREGHPAMEF